VAVLLHLFSFYPINAVECRANQSDYGENVFNSDDHMSSIPVAAIIDGDGGVSANWRGVALAAELTQALWRKSSFSASNGQCVEVAVLRQDLVGVRDSKELGQGPALIFDGVAWTSFIESIKHST
jgi:uncharacterized protein DUF397